jgi:hypothetical protein
MRCTYFVAILIMAGSLRTPSHAMSQQETDEKSFQKILDYQILLGGINALFAYAHGQNSQTIQKIFARIDQIIPRLTPSDHLSTLERLATYSNFILRNKQLA